MVANLEYTKDHWILHFKRVNFIVCKISQSFLKYCIIYLMLRDTFYWSLVDLQCCVSFRGIAELIQLYLYIYPIFVDYFPI